MADTTPGAFATCELSGVRERPGRAPAYRPRAARLRADNIQSLQLVMGDDKGAASGNSVVVNPMKDEADATGATNGDAFALTKADAQLYAKAVGSPTNFHQVRARARRALTLWSCN